MNQALRKSSLEWNLGALVAAMGVAVLVGWVFDITALKTMLPGRSAMKANTAVAFLLCGLAVAFAAGAPGVPRRRLVALLAGGAALIGGMAFAEELLSFNSGIDELLFRDPGGPSRVSRPGRMTPSTAFCFLAVAGALTLTVMPERLRLQLPLAAALSATAASIGLLFLVADISNKMLGYRWGRANSMALHTALGFVCLGVAVLLRARRLRASSWALGGSGTAGLVAGVVLMLGAAELAASFAREMEDTISQVVRTQQTLQRLQEVRTHLRALESAQNAYLVLADDSLLESREASKTAVRDLVASLGNAPRGEAPQPGQLEGLRQAIEQRLAFGDQMIAVRRMQGFEAARAIFASGEATALSSKITKFIAPMVQLERDRLAERQHRLRAVTVTTFLMLPIGSFLGLAALLSGLFFLEQGSDKRRRSEQALVRSQAQLQVVFDSMAEGVRVVDPSHAIVRMNPAGASFHGLIEPAQTLDAIVAQVDALSPAGDVLTVNEWPTSRALQGDFVRNLELKFRRRDTGGVLVVEITTAPLPIEPGQPAHVVVTSHDITARTIAEAAIRESQDRLEKIVENLTEGLLIYGLKGELVHWNRAALSMYELAHDAAEAMTQQEARQTFELSTLDGAVVPFERWPMARLKQGEILHGLELRVRRIGQEWERVFSYGGALVRDSSDKPLAFLSVNDVTARMTAELQLQQLNAELEQRVAQRTGELQAKTRELEGFCYSVSHDLKAPLRGIDGYSRLLADEYGDKLDADARLFIANVRKGTTQMNDLIEDLLAYSQQDRRTFVSAVVRLRPFIDDQIARRAADLTGVRLNVAVEDVRVRVDREGLAMAVRNLIDNAIKFSSRSNPALIDIHSLSYADRCVLTVQDNGTGFEMRHYAKVFELFQRLHRAEDYPGTGVGLAMVRKAMERMGGRVWAESEPGQGAAFHLELELAGDTGTPDTTY
jgi:signal transduction histidine kinase